MARRRDRERSRQARPASGAGEPVRSTEQVEPAEQTVSPRETRSVFWSRPRLILAVSLLLSIHAALAVTSLVRENPTIDEVAHLPAGLTYWQTGSFRLYPHNPPLIKMAAALPLLLAGPETSRLYTRPSWQVDPPIHSSFAHEFMAENVDRYFELFTLGRLVIPAFSVVGGLAVFLWARRLYGPWGGLLSLSLWALCPNILAHSRLVTSDVGATSLGVLASFLFWRYLKRPTGRLVVVAGVSLGLAMLAKFSNVLLFGLWPLMWLIEQAPLGTSGLARRFRRGLGHGLAVVGLALLTINLGYGFEGSFRPIGSFEFGSAMLTKDRPPGMRLPVSANGMLNRAWEFRVNRFRDSPLGAMPAPLPEQFLIGFDLQKLDAEGVPLKFFDPTASDDEWTGYPVYLDGEIRQRGWWYYYLAAAAFKIPEGTWVIGVWALGLTVASRRARALWPDELSVLVVPLVVLLVMSFGTDINLGLRYILPAFPYIFIASGKVAPWVAGLGRRPRTIAAGVVSVCLAGNLASVAMIRPHYLAYFNTVSGGPGRGSEHLIDSNLDWGQDLVNLRDWIRENAPGERVGLAYFGQVNPNVMRLRREGFDWFVPPVLHGTIRKTIDTLRLLDGPAPRLEPGLYAVSASYLRGLPYTFYDSSLQVPSLYPAWDSRNAGASGRQAFTYFQALEPEAHVGHSILIYRVTPEQAAQLNEANTWADPSVLIAPNPAG